ncbi:MAG TPA: hypothetical protein VKB67_15230 [Rhizomicrobium sp.]|nr:hypothetical protein [Rhizomicrobium sp.]
MARSELDKVLEHINRDRRGFFKALLIGTAIAAPLMTTQAMAQKEGEDPGPGGKCDEGLVVSKKTGKCAVPKKKKGM